MNFLHYKIIGASKKFKHQLSPLVKPSSLNFGQNFYKSISWDSSFKTQEYLYSVLYSFFSVAPKSQHLAVVTTILHLLLPVCVRSYLYV
jgi:hypothetical protein